MKKKIWLIPAALAATLCLCFGIAACEKEPSDDNQLDFYWGKDKSYYIVEAEAGFLGEIEIPDEWHGVPVKKIANSAFKGHSSLTSIVIPDSVTSIGKYAFYGCSGLTSIVIPANVTSIGDWAFSGCYKLTIYCEADKQPAGWDYWWNSDRCHVEWGYKNS